MRSNGFDLLAYLSDLEYLVNIDSGSFCPEGTEKVASFFAQKFKSMGWYVKSHQFDAAIGPCLEITNNNSQSYDVVLLGHMDTVFETGTVNKRPFVIQENQAFGPGVNDMKAGLLYIYYVLESLQKEGQLSCMSVCVALNSDEEISSKFSRTWIEAIAKRSKCVLVLEAARADGDLVNKRKGVGRYKVEIRGKAAHSGVDFQKGRSAVEELAHWIIALHKQTNYETETTVNVGIVSGGTAVNVVPERAIAEVDVRFYDFAAAKAIENLMHNLVANPHVNGVTSKLSGGITRPPMLPSETTLELCRKIEDFGLELGIKVDWSATGGGSDGSFAAILGIPTVDGLGPIGGGSHGMNEYLCIDSIEPRFYLLRRIIQYIASTRN